MTRAFAIFRVLIANERHQPLRLAAWYLLGRRDERLPHPPVAVGVVVGCMQLADPSKQPLILDCSQRAAAAAALVVRGHRHAQRLADRLDPEAATVLVDVASLRSVWVELLGEKHARRLQDLVRATQLEVARG